MPSPHQLAALQKFQIPGLVSFDLGRGGLPRATVTTPSSSAEIYLHGAQVTGFQLRGQAPLLFLSELSQFAEGKAIRGGVPICLPWFGPRPGYVAHGFARITDWAVLGTEALPGQGVRLQLGLPDWVVASRWSPFSAQFVVTVSDELAMELIVTNTALDQALQFENCLHTYFRVGDVHAIAISGLESTPYLDHTADNVVRQEPHGPIHIRSHVDRTYLDARGTVAIHDPTLGRTVQIEKNGAASTVVWNPWSTQPLADLGREEYRHMVCVESGNVQRNRLALAPGESSRMRVALRLSALKAHG